MSMATHEAAQSVHPPFHHREAAAWGDRDDVTDTMPIYCRGGLLFTMDMRSGRCFEPSEEVCYFIGADGCNMVKIGKSIDVKKRLRCLQMSSPLKLKVLALARGGGEQERAYHDEFRAWRSWGEWFVRAAPIEREIVKLKKNLSRAEKAAMEEFEYVIEENGEWRKEGLSNG